MQVLQNLTSVAFKLREKHQTGSSLLAIMQYDIHVLLHHCYSSTPAYTSSKHSRWRHWIRGCRRSKSPVRLLFLGRTLCSSNQQHQIHITTKVLDSVEDFMSYNEPGFQPVIHKQHKDTIVHIYWGETAWNQCQSALDLNLGYYATEGVAL